MSYSPVLSKADFVRRYARGEFGNCSPTWDSFVEWSVANLGASKTDLFHIRNRIAGARTWTDVPKGKMCERWVQAVSEYSASQLYISAMCPTERTIINAEVMEQPGAPLALFYSTVRKPMRDSLKEGGRQVYGVTAQRILREVMDENSYEWLMLLLERYPLHVVEFTSLEICWGTVPDYNSLFWECRRY